MAKRFTDTDKWNRPWFAALPAMAKLAWFNILDRCDHAGVWHANFRLLSFDLGAAVSKEKFEQWFGPKVVKIDGDKYLIPSFIDFQYTRGLNPNVSAHKYPLSVKEKYSAQIVQSNQDEEKELTNPSVTLSEELPNPYLRVQDKDKDKVKVKDKKGGVGGNKTQHPLEELWNAESGNLPKVRGLGGQRRKHADARLAEHSDPEYWRSVLARIRASDFCTGRNDRGWKADFDWFVKPETHLKVLEGKYDNKGLRLQPVVNPEWEAEFKAAREKTARLQAELDAELDAKLDRIASGCVS